MSKKPVFAKPVKKQTMAEQMAESIQEAILSGELKPGIGLPTEPELAEQFQVSRAVVRDATRILMARGLVQVEHGRGVFVTQTSNKAFGEALLLALRRVGASAWDVEQFEQILLPELMALAAISASDEEIAEIQETAESYLELIIEQHTTWRGQPMPESELERLMDAYRELMLLIFAATHNHVFLQLAEPLLGLRNLREWADSEEDDLEQIVNAETTYLRSLIDAIATRDPVRARETVSQLMALPPEAEAAMRQTPVGEIARIPIPLPTRMEK